MKPSVEHGSFVIERTYPATPSAVFAAWATREAKNRWFGEGDDFLAVTTEYSLQFEVGGRERLAGRTPSGRVFDYDAIYMDIVADQRMVTAYDVHVDGRRISASLMTVELHEADGGTALRLTEQGAFLDGLDDNAQREVGAADMLDQLGAYLERPVALTR